MRPRILYLGTLIVGLGLWTVFAHRQNQILREEVAGSRARLEDFKRLEAENVRLKGMITRQQINENELQQLRQEARDVLRLRGEVTSLRNVRQENEELTTNIYQLSNQLQTAIQIANEWRNYKTSARAGTPPNGPTELGRQSREGTASPVSPGLQPAVTGSANFPQHSGTVSQTWPGLVAPTPGSSVGTDQGPGSLPLDHPRVSNQSCASCHPGVTPQGKLDSEALLGAAETLVSRH